MSGDRSVHCAGAADSSPCCSDRDFGQHAEGAECGAHGVHPSGSWRGRTRAICRGRRRTARPRAACDRRRASGRSRAWRCPAPPPNACLSMSPMLGSAWPTPWRSLASAPILVPAPTRACIFADRATLRPSNVSSDRMVPSLLTSGVKEWPAPATRIGLGADLIVVGQLLDGVAGRAISLRRGRDEAGPVLHFSALTMRRSSFRQQRRGRATPPGKAPSSTRLATARRCRNTAPP